MGNFAPMQCRYCGAGPYTGPTFGEHEDNLRAKHRMYDCESNYSDANSAWHVTDECARRLLADDAFGCDSGACSV